MMTERRPPLPTPRLYIFDCGVLHICDLTRFSLQRSEVATTDLSVPCFLVVHGKGTLIWDVGAVADAEWTPTGQTLVHRLSLPDGKRREVALTRPLLPQLESVGYEPREITFLALSHFHYDHTANANAFAHSTWLVRPQARDAMFAVAAPATTRPTTYSALKDAPTVYLTGDDHDVFGDGTVVIKSAPGHTPGHQVLAVSLAHSGRILLSGDLYHYPQERTLDRIPTFEFDAAVTRTTRIAIEGYLRATGGQLWIQHDAIANAALRKAPHYYD